MRIYDTAIRIERPNGEIETVTKRGDWTMELSRIRKATADAGKGHVISARLIATNVEFGCPHYTVDQGCPLHGEICS
jgi:hypothetical protein